MNWKKEATNIIKSELEKQDINYPELSKRLEKIGIITTRQNLSNKIQKGNFSFTLALQILSVLDVENFIINKKS